jgi:alkaline phosphatase D
MGRWYEEDLSRVARARLSRRGFLAASAVGVLAACTGDDGGAAPITSAPAPRVSLSSDPFALGVASGDPLADGVVLWTRLAPAPLEPGGGMPADDVEVAWEIGTDEDLRTLASAGTAIAGADLAHTVHVDARGLEPDREYWYRFRVGDYESRIARTRTAPETGRTPGALRVGHVSCARYDSAYFIAYDDMAARNVDLVIHCGDYIYEQPSSSPVRDDPLPEAIDLDGYRAHYALYRSDPALRAAHEVAPWIVTFDDHEVENNYTGTSGEPDSDTPTREAFVRRRADAYRAWWEHMPVRFDPPTGPDLVVYRSLQWGDLARFHVLDTRQYRSDQVCATGSEDIGPRCDAVNAPDFTVLGDRQEEWLAGAVTGDGPAWDVVVQQVLVSQWRFAPGNAVWNLDQWDGYPAARDRFLATLRDTSAANTVVLTGDVHSSWVGTLALDFDDPAAEVVGTEFVAPGVGSEAPDILAQAMPAIRDNSPFIRYGEVERRGWVQHEITADTWSTEFRLVDDATVAGSPVQTASAWVVESGEPVTRA